MPRQNTSPSDYPQAVLRQIELLAQNIVIARKRRGETQAQWAKRLGVSQPTMARIERGDPSVAMASYVMCMWLINQADGLADLIAPDRDMGALEREVRRVRSPARKGTTKATTAWPAAQAPVQSLRVMEEAKPSTAFSASLGKANAAGLAALLNQPAKTGEKKSAS